MRIRIFRAPTLAEAMTQIRLELGADALILSDRSRDGFVEVTAALEASGAPELRTPASPQRERDKPASDDLEPFNAAPPIRGRASLDVLLGWHGLSPALVAALASGPLEQACARTFRYAALRTGPGADPLLFAGPPGAGKTLTVARMATRLVLAGESPMVITADGKRAGAVEQLAAFTRLLGLTLVAANTPATLARALERRASSQAVLIDAPGLDLDDPPQAETLHSLLAASNAAMALVLPCGLDPSEAQDIAEAHAAFGAQGLIATRTDLSRRMGGILCAAAAADLPLSEAGIGCDAADSLVAMTPAFLAERLQRGGERAGRSAAPHVMQPRPATPAASLLDVHPRDADRRVITRSALPLHIAAQRRAASSL